MIEWKLNTPVAFLIFNRPDTTIRVFERIREARPPKLLVIADGPRNDRPGELDACRAARAVIEKVDWPCEVLKNYSDKNLGCKRRVSTGLDWVFNTVQEAIILEDDCLPDLSFFRFCEELLEKYRNDARIMMISGDNFQFGNNRNVYSYYFSQFTHIWGWASWQRAWKFYDAEMKLWPEVKENGCLMDILDDCNTVRYWSDIFRQVYAGRINTWDYQWTFACWMQRGLAITPQVNLVSNIGFGSQSTHTSSSNSPYASMKTCKMQFPLLHPQVVLRDSIADLYTSRTIFSAPTLIQRIINRIRQALK